MLSNHDNEQPRVPSFSMINKDLSRSAHDGSRQNKSVENMQVKEDCMFITHPQKSLESGRRDSDDYNKMKSTRVLQSRVTFSGTD